MSTSARGEPGSWLSARNIGVILSGMQHQLMGVEPIRLPAVGGLAELVGGLKLFGGPEWRLNASDGGFGGGVGRLEVGDELGDSKAGPGIAEVGGDFSEGDKDEGALGETGMRNFEAGR